MTSLIVSVGKLSLVFVSLDDGVMFLSDIFFGGKISNLSVHIKTFLFYMKINHIKLYIYKCSFENFTQAMTFLI